jgi:hypothetical protein
MMKWYAAVMDQTLRAAAETVARNETALGAAPYISLQAVDFSPA